jgi:anhydro-N-acetylmuramic acid kinase
LQASAGEATVNGVARLNKLVGEKFAEAAQKCIQRFGAVDLIGSHGQTICHRPREGFTLQIGESAIIAARTGVPVVADFRQADMAVGGQGAPLVPYVDWALFRSAEQNRVLLNIGGIANCTILPAGCSLDQVRGWDTGPGNMVMDYWAQRLWNKAFDQHGKMASEGKANQEWLDIWLGHPFFRRQPPKTAGREEFGAEFAAVPLMTPQYLGWEFDVLATAATLTVKTIAQSLLEHSGLSQFQVLVSGGGAYNSFLIKQLRQELRGNGIKSLDSLGVLPERKEGLAFAILAHETMNGVPSNVPGVTGAEKAVVLGKIVRG